MRREKPTQRIPHQTLAEIAAELSQKHNQTPHPQAQQQGSRDVTTRIETIQEPS